MNPVLHQEESTQQYSVSVSVSEKPLPAHTSVYKGILITKNDLREILEEQFTTYGIKDQIPMAEAVVVCESHWNIYANNGVSFGITQFTPATWKDFGSGDIYNPLFQFQTMAKMFKMGLQKRWDCFRMLSKVK